MSRRRHERHAAESRRHPHPRPTAASAPDAPLEDPPRVVVHEARHVERLAYTRSQAALALGVSPSSLRRLLPYVETVELPWGRTLIPVDELERLLAERRRDPITSCPLSRRGRSSSVPPQIVARIREGRATGMSFRRIADALNGDGTPTAHGGERWWPSTVRAVLLRAE